MCIETIRRDANVNRVCLAREYTYSIESVVIVQYRNPACYEKFSHFLIILCSCEKGYNAMSVILAHST